MYERKELFDLLLDCVKETAAQYALDDPQAFGRWFLDLYFEDAEKPYVSDGTRDGKVDVFARVGGNGKIRYVDLTEILYQAH